MIGRSRSAAPCPAHGRQRFLATWGIWFNATIGRTLGQWRSELADELLAIARELDNPDFLLEAYHARVPGLLRTADFPALKESTQEVIRLYDRDVTAITRFILAATTVASARAAFMRRRCGGWASPIRPTPVVMECIEDARDLGHTFHLALAHSRGWPDASPARRCGRVPDRADELYPLAERNRFPWPLTYARFQRGWLAAQDGDGAAGIRQMLEAAEGEFARPPFRRSCWSPDCRAADARKGAMRRHDHPRPCARST